MPGIGDVVLTKKRGQRTIRLRISARGEVHVTAPWLVPQQHALNFVLAKKEWILSQQKQSAVRFYSGMAFGKNMNLNIIEHSAREHSRITRNILTVQLKGSYTKTKDQNQIIEKAIIRALRKESENLLLPHLDSMSASSGIDYSSATVKQLTGRWGSCDSRQNIVLSLFLVQLPWKLIEYVMIHELAHTMHLNHSAAFWTEVENHCPDYRDRRKHMKTWQPRIYEANAFMA